MGESLELVQSWLLVRVGKMYGSLMRLPEIELPYLREHVKSGYDMVEVECSRYSLQRLDGSLMPIVFRDSGPLPFRIVEYSHVADLPLPGLIESCKSEVGAQFSQDHVKGGDSG
ncbi:hypothetical protein EII12_03380 [Buchananella hordeovulneris]|nr:hypothetical protein EII12_03380 [Buchananella hordeovulneris]